MSAPTSPAAHRRKPKKEKVPFWKRDLGSLRSNNAGAEEVIEHPEFAATLPLVNLLPSSVPDAISAGRVTKLLVVMGALVVIAMGTLWYLQGATIDQAQRQLDQAQFENAQLQASTRALAPVIEARNDMNAQRQLIANTLASEPESTQVVERLVRAARAAGKGAITFTGTSITYQGIPLPTAELNPCPKPDPFVKDVTIGCLNFTATAGSREQVTQFLEALAKDDFFVGPYITMTTVNEGETAGTPIVSFTGTAGVSPKALKTPLTQAQVDALMSSLTPTPTPSPEGGSTP